MCGQFHPEDILTCVQQICIQCWHSFLKFLLFEVNDTWFVTSQCRRGIYKIDSLIPVAQLHSKPIIWFSKTILGWGGVKQLNPPVRNCFTLKIYTILFHLYSLRKVNQSVLQPLQPLLSYDVDNSFTERKNLCCNLWSINMYLTSPNSRSFIVNPSLLSKQRWVVKGVDWNAPTCRNVLCLFFSTALVQRDHE